MDNILDKIIAAKKQEIDSAKQETSLEVLREKVIGLPKCRNFYRALTKQNPRQINVVAEIKRASPSAGLIRDDFDPVKLAKIYADAGADAISVLTDEKFFQGHLDYLKEVISAVELPVLRKDFIIDPYQVYQSRLAGADAILLIAEALPIGTLADMMILANSLGLTVLLEVHQIESLLQVRSMIGFPLAGYSLLGINNRNLKTMETDLENSIRLSGLLEDTTGLISESGIRTRRDVERLIAADFSGILIGETLMREPNIKAKFEELFDPPSKKSNL